MQDVSRESVVLYIPPFGCRAIFASDYVGTSILLPLINQFLAQAP
jgi:hypothetical protein